MSDEDNDAAQRSQRESRDRLAPVDEFFILEIPVLHLLLVFGMLETRAQLGKFLVWYRKHFLDNLVKTGVEG